MLVCCVAFSTLFFLHEKFMIIVFVLAFVAFAFSTKIACNQVWRTYNSANTFIMEFLADTPTPESKTTKKRENIMLYVCSEHCVAYIYDDFLVIFLSIPCHLISRFLLPFCCFLFILIEFHFVCLYLLFIYFVRRYKFIYVYE